jgi:hypothetical protein
MVRSGSGVPECDNNSIDAATGRVPVPSDLRLPEIRIPQVMLYLVFESHVYFPVKPREGGGERSPPATRRGCYLKPITSLFGL